jgi:hypothetical protein
VAFIQCSAEQAEEFVKFMLESGAWTRAPVGNWIAHKLTKTKPTTEDDPHHCVLDVLVIHKNAKGIHSFDPLFGKAYAGALSREIQGSLENMIGSRLSEIQKEGTRRTLAKALAHVLPERLDIIETKVQADGRVDVTFSIPADLAKTLGLS